jgi:hypothetical protein
MAVTGGRHSLNLHEYGHIGCGGASLREVAHTSSTELTSTTNEKSIQKEKEYLPKL